MFHDQIFVNYFVVALVVASLKLLISSVSFFLHGPAEAEKPKAGVGLKEMSIERRHQHSWWSGRDGGWMADMELVS